MSHPTVRDLFVEDWQNNRILVYNPFPTSNNPTANIVLGQPDFVHNDENAATSPTAQALFVPFGMSLVGNQLIVDDVDNNRFLIFSMRK